MNAFQNLYLPRTILPAALVLALSLVGCKGSPAAPVDDSSLTAAVQSRIAGDGAISTEPIQSAVKDQTATLNGTVSSEAARALAASDAAQVAGIKTVVNNLTVQAPAPTTAMTAMTATPPPAPTRPAPTTPAPKPAAKPKPAPVVRQDAPPPPPEPAPQQVAATPPPPVEAPSPAPLPPPPPPTPAFHNISVPPDTVIPIRITQTLDSATTQQGDLFTGTVATDVIVDGLVVIRQGTSVSGRVSEAQEAAHYKGNSLLTVELTSINRRGEKIPVTTEPYSVKGAGRGANTAEKIGGGAAVGAILGGIIGGGKGAAIGAAAGGGAGAGVNTVTRGQQVQIPSETLIRFTLTNTLALKVPTNGDTSNPDSTPTLQQRPATPPQQ